MWNGVGVGGQRAARGTASEKRTTCGEGRGVRIERGGVGGSGRTRGGAEEKGGTSICFDFILFSSRDIGRSEGNLN
jgi:hypothetical protein